MLHHITYHVLYLSLVITYYIPYLPPSIIFPPPFIKIIMVTIILDTLKMYGITKLILIPSATSATRWPRTEESADALFTRTSMSGRPRGYVRAAAPIPPAPRRPRRPPVQIQDCRKLAARSR
jgi:hypothetical protein